jgi:tRNA (guanine37-N1)-methyltransferase
MRRFDILTIFPRSLDSYFNESIAKRARAERLVTVQTHDIRDYAADKHRTTDDKPYGGGAGMVMKVEPIYRALRALRAISHKAVSRKAGSKSARRAAYSCRTILLAANGKQFTQRDAVRLARYRRLVFVCGRYEGVDERVKEFVDETVSVGPYVLTGGELPAATIIDAVIRHVPGVLGNEASSRDESFADGVAGEYPHYTRPESFRGQRVPAVLLSGDHAAIARWRASKRTPPKRSHA